MVHAEELDPNMVAHIELALPKEPATAPKQKRKLLLFNLCKGFVHGSIPYGTYAIKRMGETTGAYTATVSDDPAVFSAESLAQYDAILLLNTTGTLFEDETLKQNLVDFVKNGKGLAGIHAATDCFYDWAEFGEMMGGYFDGHPWGASSTVGVQLDDPGHPINEPFHAQGFMIKDEIYQYRDEPYSREKLRVLMSLDHDKTDMKRKNMKREDGDYAVGWIQSYGDGRVFYNNLGHNHDTYWNAPVMEHFLAGIQYALGDLEADATPSADLPADHKEKSAAAIRDHALTELMADIAIYDFDQPAGDLEIASAMVIDAFDTPDERERLASAFTDILASDASWAAKQFATKQLYLIGSEESVDALAALLSDEKTADIARYALERNPAVTTGAALQSASRDSSSAARIGIIHSLGWRGEQQAVPAIAKLASEDNAATARAALQALGNIGGAQASRAVKSAYQIGRADTRLVAAEAYLKCAEHHARDGDRRKALAIYEDLSQVNAPVHVQVAALRGRVQASGSDGTALIVAALKSGSSDLQMAAARLAAESVVLSTTAVLAEALPTLSPEAQVHTLRALADRGDKSAGSAVQEFAETTEDSTVYAAALEALARIGSADSVPTLLASFTREDREAAGTAVYSLSRLTGVGIDYQFGSAFRQGDLTTQAAILQASRMRGEVALAPLALQAIEHSDPELRAIAYWTLETVGAESDIPVIVRRAITERNEKTRSAAEDAIVRIAKHNDSAAEIIMNSLTPKESAAEGAQGTILRVLTRIGDDASLPMVRAAAASTDPAIREAGILSLVNWPTATPIKDVERMAASGKSKSDRLIGLRGYLRMLTLPTDRPADETVQMYERALALASREEEKKIAMAGLAAVDHPRKVIIAKRYQGDPAVKDEVQLILEEADK
jgi:type 1 glutamine amidotransferase/HEAT repeat protein